MPHAACFQDWTHIRGSVNASVTQDAAAWFDLSRYCSFWPMIDVRGFAGAPTLYLEFAPTKDEAFFTTINGPGSVAGVGAVPMPSFYPVGAVGYQATPLFGGPPQAGGMSLPSRFMRWRVTSATASWALTFRVWLNLLPARTSRVRAATARTSPKMASHGSAAAHSPEGRATWLSLDDPSLVRAAPEPGEFARLRRAFPRLPKPPAPRALAAREAYETLSRALEPNHPALVSVRTALARRYPTARPERPRPRNPNGGPPIHFVPPPPPMAPEDAAAMSSYIAQGLAAMRFPPAGAAWSIVQVQNGVPTEVAYDKRGVKGFQQRDVHLVSLPFTNDTAMNCFSLSKTVTAIAVMKAIEMYVATLTSSRAAPRDPGVTAASLLASPLVDGPFGDLIMRGWMGDASDTGVVNPAAQTALTQVTVADLLAHTAGLARGILPGTTDWTRPGFAPGADVAQKIRKEISDIDPSDIGGVALYSNTGYWLLRDVVASIAWLVEGTDVDHGDATDTWVAAGGGPGDLATREQSAGTQYNAFVRQHVFGTCFDAYGKHFETPHLKTTDDQSSYMPAKPALTHDKLRWVPSFDPAVDAPVWALGGESDWVFSARSYAWFIACVEAGMVIDPEQWGWLKNPSTVPVVPGPTRPHEPYGAKNPWGLRVAAAPSPPAASPLPGGTIYYKRGDGVWNQSNQPSRRITEGALLVRSGDTNAQAFAVEAHAEWLLVGDTVICAVINSSLNPNDRPDASTDATLSLHGLLLDVLNAHKWRGL
jgi:CubicO group peptidase (beta-lactamase class C family)